MSLSEKNCFSHLLGNFWVKLGHFLFQDLVTLPGIWVHNILAQMKYKSTEVVQTFCPYENLRQNDAFVPYTFTYVVKDSNLQQRFSFNLNLVWWMERLLGQPNIFPGNAIPHDDDNVDDEVEDDVGEVDDADVDDEVEDDVCASVCCWNVTN